MAGRPVGHGQVLLALGERGEQRDLFVVGEELAREMAGGASDIVGADVDAAVADRQGTQQIDGKAADMGQAVRRCGALDGAANQRRGRSGVLVFSLPRPTGQRAGAKMTVVQLFVGRIHPKASLRSRNRPPLGRLEPPRPQLPDAQRPPFSRSAAAIAAHSSSSDVLAMGLPARRYQ